MTKREAEALDNAKRVLLEAEKADGSYKVDKLIRIADRWLTLASQSS